MYCQIIVIEIMLLYKFIFIKTLKNGSLVITFEIGSLHIHIKNIELQLAIQ